MRTWAENHIGLFYIAVQLFITLPLSIGIAYILARLGATGIVLQVGSIAITLLNAYFAPRIACILVGID